MLYDDDMTKQSPEYDVDLREFETEEPIDPHQIPGLRSPFGLIAEGLVGMARQFTRGCYRLACYVQDSCEAPGISHGLRAVIATGCIWFGWMYGVSLVILDPTGPMMRTELAGCVAFLLGIVTMIGVAWRFGTSE